MIFLLFLSLFLFAVSVNCASIVVNFPTPYQVINSSDSEFTISISTEAVNFGATLPTDMIAILSQNGKYITSSTLAYANIPTDFLTSYSGLLKIGQNISGNVDLIVRAANPNAGGSVIVSSDPITFTVYHPSHNAIYM